MDAGSTPASSTTFNAFESQHNQAIAFENKGCGFFVSKSQLVSNSPNWSTKWHPDDISSSPLSGIGTKECHNYRSKIFERHPYLANAMANQYLRVYRQQSLREANLFIGRIDKELVIHDLNLSSSVADIKAFCETISKKCRMAVIEYGENTTSYSICSAIAKKYKVYKPSVIKEDELVPALNRLSCAKWWNKQVCKLRVQLIEQVSRSLGLVSKKSSCYASEFSLECRKAQLKNSYEYLSSNTVVNEEGQSFTLLDVYKKSISNPRIRKAELMTRIRGFEEVASQMNHAGEFYTLTSPSKMHATLSNGKANPKFDGSTPKDVNKYFNDNWKLIRSALQKKNIAPYGFRVVEPHHDGTPHWHLLLFMPQEDVNKTRSIFQHYALREDGNERGAKEHRFKAISIDPNKGSAAGYIAKYISKNIDGSNLDEDLYGNDAKPAASKIDAWSSTWNIRQFQQIGGPSVSVWRELRRLKESEQPDVVNAFRAADAGDWAAYVIAMGGAILPRKERPIHLYYDTTLNESVDLETGEIIQNNLTRYGDIKAPSLKGLINRNIVNLTRIRNWTKETQPMMRCEAESEHRTEELATKFIWRGPREREAPDKFLGLV